jgi:hypothetical protein
MRAMSAPVLCPVSMEGASVLFAVVPVAPQEQCACLAICVPTHEKVRDLLGAGYGEATGCALLLVSVSTDCISSPRAWWS